MHVIGDSVSPEDVFDIAAGKMNPVYLRLIYAIVIIFLLFLGPVDDHISGGYDFLHSLKVEMRLSGGHIQDLIVQPAAGTVGGEFGNGKQMIGAAASHEQGMLFIFEVNHGIVPVGRIHIHTSSPPGENIQN